jgi:hypothetical protein
MVPPSPPQVEASDSFQWQCGDGVEWRDDANCDVPSDWMQEGVSDLYVPKVPPGFMREVVLRRWTYDRVLRNLPEKRNKSNRDVYYHYCEPISDSSGKGGRFTLRSQVRDQPTAEAVDIPRSRVDWKRRNFRFMHSELVF